MAIVFTSDSDQDVRENISAGSVIYTAQADHDDAAGTSISYSLEAGHSSNLSIDSNTGEVILAVSPDFETDPIAYGFTVIATDGNITNSHNVSINVIDIQEGDASNDTFTSSTSNDLVDGAGGYNTFEIEGTPDAFIWTVNSAGEYVVTDYVTGGNDAANVSDQGVDTLVNIHRLAFVDPTDSSDTRTKYVVLDDYANTTGSNNTRIEYGEEINARLNFTGDTDNFILTATSGQRIKLDFDSSHTMSLIANGDYSNSWLSRWSDGDYIQSSTGDIDVTFSQYYNYDHPGDGSSPNSTQSYSFTYRRVMETATDNNDVLQLGNDFEWVDGLAGDDVITGSQGSDILRGGDGDDQFAGGSGNDYIYGDAGSANIAVFSGNRNDYEIRAPYDNLWNDSKIIFVEDNVNDRDGLDTLTDIQILRFNDQDIVFDNESNKANPSERYSLGEVNNATLPLTPQNQRIPDQDYTTLVLGPEVTSDTALRLSIQSDEQTDGEFNLRIYSQFSNSNYLRFEDLDSGNIRDSFYHNLQSNQASEYFLNIKDYSGGDSFEPSYHSFDVKVNGNANSAQAEFGDLLNYSVRFDLVKLGSSAANTIDNTESDTFAYVNAKAGDDIILGGDHNETLVGDIGNDDISGGLGDDIIIDHAGTNTLSGGAGDDTFNLSGSSVPKGIIDGGEGEDTLILAANTDWSNLQVTNVEVLQVDGDPGITIDEVKTKGFTSVKNATFALDGGIQDGGNLDVTGLQGQINLKGSNQSDMLVGNDQANSIYLQSGYHNGIGLAADTIQAADGDDTIIFGHYERLWDYLYWQDMFTSANIEARTYNLEGSIDGGLGKDTFELRFESGNWGHAWGGTASDDNHNGKSWFFDLSNLNLTNIEELKVVEDSNYNPSLPSGYTFTASQLTGLSAASGLQDITIVDGGNLDLAHLATLGIADNWYIGDANTYIITGTDQSEQLLLGQGTMTINMLAGDDTLVIDGAAKVTGSLDGGTGTNTLKINSGDVDLSSAALANIDAIDVAANSLSMSQAQWDIYGDLVSIRTGADTKFTLSLDTSSNITLTESADYFGLSGSEYDDTFIGNSADNVLTGNSGNDNLQGKAGDDRLIAGAGSDTLQGGAGNDRLDVRGKLIVTDVIAGGDDVDTLVVEDGQDLTGASISGIEAITGSGTITLRTAQLDGLKNLYGVSIQLVDSTEVTSIPAGLSMSSGSRIILAEADSEIIGTESGVIGSAKDDIINGSDQDDIILGGRGADKLVGGAGDDSLYGGKGVNTLSGGEGDDTLIVGGNAFSQNYQAIAGEALAGGAGIDTLQVDFNDQYGGNYDLKGALVTGIEKLSLVNVNHSKLSIDASTWESLTSVSTKDGDNNWFGSQLILSVKGDYEDIDFTAVSGASPFNNVTLNGNFEKIDLSVNPTYFNNNESHYEYYDVVKINADFTELVGSLEKDNIFVYSDNNFSANLGAGDDRLRLSTNTNPNSIVIDGGEGNDTFDVSNGYLIDLSLVSLTNVENVYHGGTKIVVTDSQFASWSLDGSGAVYVTDGTTITGTKGNDNYSGDGAGAFAGGEGDDNIGNVNTVVLSGNYADYDFIPAQSFTIQHARGSLLDGTDTLNNVLNIQFADTTYTIDDHVNSPYNFFENGLDAVELSTKLSQLSSAEYDKRVSGKFDYAGDHDVYTTVLAPNSPLAIEASSANGNTTYYHFWDAETGNQLVFKNLVHGYTTGAYASYYDPSDKWMPGFGYDDNFTPYNGGEVVMQVNSSSSDIEDYAFTLKYLDDYAGSKDTLGVMDPQTGTIQGYVGDIGDHDWIRTELIEGTKYQWVLSGVSSGGGSLVDPELVLRDAEGRLVEESAKSVGTDDTIIFRPTQTGSYYLDISDIADINKGSWTLTQQSLDTIAGNLSTTERIEWSSNTTFREESEINQYSDHDWFKVWLDKGITYDFTLDGQSLGGTLQDPQLSLRSVSGRLLAQDDNGGTGTDAALFYSATDSGWYFLDAGASGNAFKGTYVLRGSSLQDDYSNDRQTVGSVSVAEPTSGLITYIGDNDWFKAGFSAGTTYVIEARQDISDTARLDPLLDPLLFVRDADGNIVAQDDDFGEGLNARLFFTPKVNGEYYLDVSSAFKYDIGAYQVSASLAPADDHASVLTDSATQLTITNKEAEVDGILGAPGDKDVFQLELEADKVYQFKVNGMASNEGTLVDPYVRIFNANKQLVDFNDNSGLGNDAALYFVPNTSGTYYAEVSSGAYQGMGSFGLQVLERNMEADDYANDQSTDKQLQPGEQVQGNLLTRNDEDWFRIDLAANESYVFKLKAAFSGHGSLNNPLLELRDAGGAVVKSVDDMLLNNEPAFVYTPIANETFYLVAKASDGNQDTGSYTLITRAPDDHGNSDNDATNIVLNQTIDGAIQYNDGSFGVRAFDSVGLATDADKDWFSFTATEGDVLSFNVSFADGSLLSRPMVEIIDDNGKTLAIGDGLETDNGLAAGVFRAESSGTYYARVTDGAGATGNYQVTLIAGDASDEDASGSIVLNPIDQNGIIMAEVKASIGLAGDADTFMANLDAGHSYRIETVAVRDGIKAPLPGTEMQLQWLPSDGASETIAVAGETASPSLFAAAGFTADVDGTLNIVVAAPELMQTGQYKLRLVDLGAALEDDFIDSTSDYDELSHGVLAINENQAGNISEAGDIDLFAVNLTSGNIYDFSVKSFFDGLGSLGESQLKLLNAQGQLVTAGSYDSDTGRTDLSVSVFDNGRYFLEVTAVTLPGNTGTYTLDTRLRGEDNLTDDAGSDTQTSLVVAPGKPVAAQIDYAGDHDWLKVEMTAGKVYVLDILADGDGAGGTLSDAYLRLLDSGGNEVAMDDNAGAGKDAHIQFTPTYSGSYYLDVTGAEGTTGTYTARVRELYSGVADPLRSSQWYLDQAHIDELKSEYTGAGVTVSIVDDGIDSSHPDLQENMDLALAYDTQFDTQDGNPKYPKLIMLPPDNHGTMVAGIVGAVANNETGLVGASPDVDLVSTRVKWTMDQITEAMSRQWEFDVSNNSWGAISPFSDNFNSTALTFAWHGIREAVEDGREGLGTVIVFSAGNDAGSNDNTNYHNFQNAREVITVGAMSADDSMANFSTPGANVLISTYGEGMATTDRHQPGWGENKADLGDYVSSFSGTSASAPLVSGIVANMLEANDQLGYRDVQKILAYSATHADNQNWKANGADDWNLGGLVFNDKSGFGAVDAFAAVQLAKTWESQSTAMNEAFVGARKYGLIDAIPDGNDIYTRDFEIDANISVEHVELGIDLRHSRLGDLIVTLTSPDGTISTLMDRPTVTSERPFGLSGEDSGVPTHLLWDFSSVQFWGEDATGTWTVSVQDVRAEETGTIQSLSLRVYGEQENGNDVYVFTDEGFAIPNNLVLEDEFGVDAINGAAVRTDTLIDLEAGIIASNGVEYQIADWTIIENVYTGIGDDRVTGNETDNIIKTDAGDDIIEGGAGNDEIDAGRGADTVIYRGNKEEYNVSWNATTATLTVVDLLASSFGDDGTDILSGVERLVFADAEMSLASTIGGNAPPVANTSVFETQLQLEAGMGINYQLPDNAFTDEDGEQTSDLSISVTMEDGGELPEWMGYDEVTGAITGVPPEDYQGLLKVKIEATDDFGESGSGILQLLFGDNQAPIVDAAAEKIIAEDSGLVALNISAPVDPEGSLVGVKITELPSFGSVLNKAGVALNVGATMSANELTELHYQTADDVAGNAGYLRYEASDADGVVANSAIQLFVSAVDDAPRFVTDESKLTLAYEGASVTVDLDMQQPTDPEETLTSVRVNQLPEIGIVSLNGIPVVIEQVLSMTQLQELKFTLDENVNGPIGGVGIQATDSAGNATNWLLALEVNGDQAYSQGTSGADELYGSIADDILYGLAGDDQLVGNGGNDRLLAGLGNDTLFGGSGSDVLDGSAGNDYLDGGLDGDTMAGGPGHDTYVVETAGDIVLEVIAGGAGGSDIVVTAIDYTAPTNVEDLVAKDGMAVDLTGNGLDNSLLGNELDNVLIGNAGRDRLLGEDGNDQLEGGLGVDFMYGGVGDDTYLVDSRADVIGEHANQGKDTVITSTSYTLSSNIENLTASGSANVTLGGNSLDNHLVGNSGNNILAGGLGADILEGGLGDDIYVLNDQLDSIIDIGGIDTIRSTLDVELMVDIENVELVGIANTIAVGNAGDNTLTGNMADNTLDGRGGSDVLTGGEGSDQFVVSSNGLGEALDFISDFRSGEDLLIIDLNSFGVDIIDAGLQSSGLVSDDAFVKGAGVEALDANDHFLFDSARGILKFDIDANGNEIPIDLIDLQSENNVLLPTDVFVVI